jgi:predicted cupin superfamily sugar epimerase
MLNYKDIIERFNLKKHPEGGFFRENYRSKASIAQAALDPKYRGSRNISTAIYFLLTSYQFSAFHKIKQDEIWHFYEGKPVRIHMISEQGEYSTAIVGRAFDEGQNPQFVVPGGVWFAAEVIHPDAFAFVGCTVAPGFDFQDFEMPDRQELKYKFPALSRIIDRFTH